MRTTVILSAAMLSSAVLATPSASADDRSVDINIDCDMHSQYQVSMNGQAFLFENDTGRDTRLVLGGGKLFINGKQSALTPADQQRIDTFEAELRLLVPEARKVVAEAVSIAIDALSEVSIALSGDQGKRADYNKARAKALAAIDDSKTLPIFNVDSIDGIVDRLVAEFVPDIASSALAFAMKAMFAGEEKNKAMDARMDAMDKELDARVEARAKDLEPLAEAMCKRIQGMDAIDDSLEIRLPNGKPINFLDTK